MCNVTQVLHGPRTHLCLHADADHIAHTRLALTGCLILQRSPFCWLQQPLLRTWPGVP